MFLSDTHHNFTPASRWLSVTTDAWASDNGKPRNGPTTKTDDAWPLWTRRISVAA